MTGRRDSQVGKRKYDVVMLAVLAALLAMGLVILYSTSAYNGEVKFHDSFYYLKKQIFATLLGIAGMFVVARMDGLSYLETLCVAGLCDGCFIVAGGSVRGR